MPTLASARHNHGYLTLIYNHNLLLGKPLGSNYTRLENQARIKPA